MTDAELLKRLQKVRDWLDISAYPELVDEMNEILIKVINLMQQKSQLKACDLCGLTYFSGHACGD